MRWAFRAPKGALDEAKPLFPKNTVDPNPKRVCAHRFGGMSLTMRLAGPPTSSPMISDAKANSSVVLEIWALNVQALSQGIWRCF